ncbi:unnamed protein product [Allacma fusca]|uniref:Uncharacterized protein n=1 Tax=Allacma fusca TaxID=39272 RepID=A0A8J2LMH9_9HEXA|nr:unnamed protein product [Allacma fusca]
MKRIGPTLWNLGAWLITPSSSCKYPVTKYATAVYPANFKSRCMHRKVEEPEEIEPLPKYAQLLKNVDGTKTDQLVVIFPWLEAKKQHVNEYAHFYLNHNCDVLVVAFSWYNVLNAGAGPKAMAKDLVTFLDESSRYDRIFIHGFSVGLYLWGEVLDFLDQNQNKEFPEKGFPQSALLQKLFQKYLQIYLSNYPGCSSHDYIPSFKLVRDSDLVKSPALVLGSRDDQIWCLDTVEDTVNCWRSHGLEVEVKLWESSPHVGHLQCHKEEYEDALKHHLQRLKFHDFLSDAKPDSKK